MPIISEKPYLRFEYEYDGVITVLEGRELDRLLDNFFRNYDEQRENESNRQKAFTAATLLAYQDLYGEDVICEDDLKKLSTADARKADLFYKGMLLMLYEITYPDEDWEKIFQNKRNNLTELLNEIFMLKPNIFGVGIDVNASIKRFLHQVNGGK